MRELVYFEVSALIPKTKTNKLLQKLRMSIEKVDDCAIFNVIRRQDWDKKTDKVL